MIRLIATLAPIWFVGVLPLFGGCSSTLLAQLDNHVMVAIDDSRCSAESQWGPLALGSKINADQCKAIVDGRKARERLRQMEAGK